MKRDTLETELLELQVRYFCCLFNKNKLHSLFHVVLCLLFISSHARETFAEIEHLPWNYMTPFDIFFFQKTYKSLRNETMVTRKENAQESATIIQLEKEVWKIFSSTNLLVWYFCRWRAVVFIWLGGPVKSKLVFKDPLNIFSSRLQTSSSVWMRGSFTYYFGLRGSPWTSTRTHWEIIRLRSINRYEIRLFQFAKTLFTNLSFQLENLVENAKRRDQIMTLLPEGESNLSKLQSIVGKSKEKLNNLRLQWEEHKRGLELEHEQLLAKIKENEVNYSRFYNFFCFHLIIYLVAYRYCKVQVVITIQNGAMPWARGVRIPWF